MKYNMKLIMKFNKIWRELKNEIKKKLIHSDPGVLDIRLTLPDKGDKLGARVQVMYVKNPLAYEFQHTRRISENVKLGKETHIHVFPSYNRNVIPS